MGNYTSCLQKKPQTAKLIDLEDRIRQIQTPVKAAELMLEAPGHVVCDSKELTRTRRVLAIGADEDLVAGRVYLLFQVSRANCRVTDGDLSRILAVKGKKKQQKQKRAGKVFPEADGEEGEAEEVRAWVCLGDGGESDTGFPSQRLSNYRQWRPVLETIDEGM